MTLPKKMDETTLITNDAYPQQLQDLCQDVREGHGTIVFFTTIRRSHFPKLADLKSKCDLPILKEFKDGFIFGKQASTNPK